MAEGAKTADGRFRKIAARNLRERLLGRGGSVMRFMYLIMYNVRFTPCSTCFEGQGEAAGPFGKGNGGKLYKSALLGGSLVLRSSEYTPYTFDSLKPLQCLV